MLTGVAAVLAAAATLGALFTGGGDDAGGAAPPGATGAEPSTVPGAADDCFRLPSLATSGEAASPGSHVLVGSATAWRTGWRDGRARRADRGSSARSGSVA